VPATAANILGILSLMFWSLMLIISVKYLLYVMRADNEGEGGILALMALADPWHGRQRRGRRVVAVLGIFGAALLYGDGIITPAISVLSAVEGLEVATPVFEPYVVPITVVILVLLFALQRHGTANVGYVFGPVMVVWFSALALLGIVGIARQPHVLTAVAPTHALEFFRHNGWHGFLVLGAVFLVVTGGEALYADLGHFTRRTIRFTWFVLVLPALLLNYFGQGALLLENPAEIAQPFYHLAPAWALYPLVALATVATVIASQAIISGAFSLTRQATLLGLLPRVRIVQTSPERIGQIYVPVVNWLLMAATIALVVSFRKSSNLAAAYGIAVSITMVITTLLAHLVATRLWRWSEAWVAAITAVFLIVDFAFLGANLFRVKEGGWVPLAVGAACFTLMWTWKAGRGVLRRRLDANVEPLDAFLKGTAAQPPVRVPGTAVFMSESPAGTPPILLRHLKHSRVLHERVILLTVATEDVPHVPADQRLEMEPLGEGISRAIVRFGFMENPDVPEALRRGRELLGPEIDLDSVTYYVGGPMRITTSTARNMPMWQKQLFVFMFRNATRSVAFYALPSEQVVEIGIPVDL